MEPGKIAVMVDSSSDDIRLTGEFEMVGQTTDVSATRVFFSTVEVG